MDSSLTTFLSCVSLVKMTIDIIISLKSSFRKTPLCSLEPISQAHCQEALLCLSLQVWFPVTVREKRFMCNKVAIYAIAELLLIGYSRKWQTTHTPRHLEGRAHVQGSGEWRPEGWFTAGFVSCQWAGQPVKYWSEQNWLRILEKTQTSPACWFRYVPQASPCAECCILFS